MLLFPFAHGTEDGYYGPFQESLIQIVGGVAGTVAKTPLAKGWVGALAAGVAISCDLALYLDEQVEQDYRTESIYVDYYSMGVMQYF